MEKTGFILGSFRVHPLKNRVHIGVVLGLILGSFRVHPKGPLYTPPPIRGGVYEPTFLDVDLTVAGGVAS